ncbi:HlyD family secretion protein [Rhizobium sp. SG_E_25_P2]|uniref:HlyD family secretion protein n=1 Tax=Rhizobium sp. SG_E_25_P2 TaxID=2879942 RepID=UPI0024769DE7|nr:HlyD family efflux transporter periplasmic adaptor subunit [Rhizobium sp. SG_E_25_P2]MDH6266400.1 HlyD family secretion protein [Rhizobium sp. SG_E_25_P2]
MASSKMMPVLIAAALAAGFGYYGYKTYQGNGLPDGIAAGNGRIEAVEIDVAAKSAGRVKSLEVKEGDFVQVDQVLARIDTEQLEAQKRQAEADLRRASISVDTARSLVEQRLAEKRADQATVAQRQAQLDAAAKRLARSEKLTQTNTVALQVLDDDRASEAGARAALAAADASVAAADAAIGAARAQVVDAEAAVDASRAAIDSVDTQIRDGVLKAPRDGRVQYIVAEPGEVVASGGRVVNMVDLTDVYMTFFLSSEMAGKLALGAEARLVLDAAPQYVIPATVSFVSDVAQFTPKTVETEEERQKLMFRVRAHIAPDLLRKYITYVKTGLPGMAYVRLDKSVAWPADLEKGLVK